jgi:hypothetical protein
MTSCAVPVQPEASVFPAFPAAHYQQVTGIVEIMQQLVSEIALVTLHILPDAFGDRSAFRLDSRSARLGHR